MPTLWVDIDSTLVLWDHRRALETESADTSVPILNPQREDLWKFNLPLVNSLVQMKSQGWLVNLQSGGGPQYAQTFGNRLERMLERSFVDGVCHKRVALAKAKEGDVIVDDEALELVPSGSPLIVTPEQFLDR